MDAIEKILINQETNIPAFAFAFNFILTVFLSSIYPMYLKIIV